MPQPTVRDVHIDSALTQIAVAYMQESQGFIADQVFPIVEVDHMTDKYWTLPKGDWYRDEAQRQGDTEESVGSGFTLSQDSYSADVFGIHKDIGRQTKGNQDEALDIEDASTKFVTQRLLLRREIQWAADYFTTSIWGTDTTVTTKWDDPSADPAGDVDTARLTMLESTGFEPNTLVVGARVWAALKRSPDILDRYKYTTSDSITTEMVARVLEIDRILVAKAIKNTAVEGATASMAPVQGKHALLAYVAPHPDKFVPSAGYTFSWRAGVGGASNGYDVGIERIEMPWRNHTTRIEGQMAFDHKVVATDLGVFFPSVIS